MATVAEAFGRADWFQARDDSEASRVFQLMCDTPEGGTLTYDDLSRVLGRPFKDNRAVWQTALRRWERNCPEKGTFVNVREVGYQRRAAWEDTKAAGDHHQKKMRRQAGKAKRRYLAADRAIMTDEQRREQTAVLTRVGNLEMAMRSQKAEINFLKKKKADRSDVTELQKQVSELVSRVEALG